MIRHYLISENGVNLIRGELEHLKQNCISTPDTEASYHKIVHTLDKLRGA
jgi:hypothetical protein